MIVLNPSDYIQARLTAIPSGAIKAVTIAVGGTGYTPGTVTLTVVQAGASGGTLTATASAGGIITSIDSIATSGILYSIADGLATTCGAGADCTVNITNLYQPSYACSYIGTDDIPGESSGFLNGTTAVIILSAPIAGQRMLDMGIISNADKAAVTPIIELISGGNTIEIVPRQALQINQTILFGRQAMKGEDGVIGGSSGNVDNAILRADSTGGATIQNSLATINDTGSIDIPTGETYNINGSAHTHSGYAPTANPTFTGTVETTTTHATTILVDHIGEHTGSHKIVLDNTLSRAGIIEVDHLAEATGAHTIVHDNPISVDHIEEVSSGHGVVCDGVTLKDGGALIITGGTNTFNLTNGTASLDILTAKTVNIDDDVTVSAELHVEAATHVNQDLTSDASPTFNQVNATTVHTTTILTDHLGEHTAGHNIVCDNNITAPNIKAWRLIPAADFTTAPASTSTITFSVDYTTTALVGMFVRYTIGGVEYFGQLTAVAAALWTVRGAPLSGNITNLYYGGGDKTQAAYDGSKNPDGTALTTVLATGTVQTIRWRGQKSYLVGYSAFETVHDGGTHGKFTVKINGTECNTSAGGLVIAANATWYATVVDLDVAAYDVNYGEDITFVKTVGTTGDAYGLMFEATIVTP